VTRRLLSALAAAALLLAGCRSAPAVRQPSPAEADLLAAKADGRVARFLSGESEGAFAAVAVFDADVFAYRSALLDRLGIPALNVLGNTAILLLDGTAVVPLLSEPSVRKVRYLCRQGRLPRIDPLFEMELLRSFGEGREDEPVSFMARFLEEPGKNEAAAVEAAGFGVVTRAGNVWVLQGPFSSLHRLLDLDELIYYSEPSKQKKM
jgi:hypothetical protein